MAISATGCVQIMLVALTKQYSNETCFSFRQELVWTHKYIQVFEQCRNDSRRLYLSTLGLTNPSYSLIHRYWESLQQYKCMALVLYYRKDRPMAILQTACDSLLWVIMVANSIYTLQWNFNIYEVKKSEQYDFWYQQEWSLYHYFKSQTHMAPQGSWNCTQVNENQNDKGKIV